MTTMTLFVIVIGPFIGGLTANFLYAAAHDRNWDRAIEWTMAQGAICVCILATAMIGKLL